MFRNAIFATIAAAVLTAAALAHASLKSSSISDGEVLETRPSEISLEYSCAVGLAALTLQTGAGEAVDWDYRPPRRMQAAFTASLPPLDDGDYVLSWRAMAGDGHVMTGEIAFVLAAGNAG